MRTHSFEIAVAIAALGLGCSDRAVPAPFAGPREYRATLRRTSFGIPHIQADDWGSLGFGVGHAGAEDFVCILADQILKVRSERAATFGRGDDDANVESDLVYLGLGVRKTAESVIALAPADLTELIEGYVAGYNAYVAHAGPQGLPAPCTGATWVKPIEALDLVSYYVDLTLRGSSVPLLSYIADAGPPGSKAKSGTTDGLPLLPMRNDDLGSNGWAIGSDMAASGRGMLVANPHFPWETELKFYEMHVTIPGTVDAYGAGLLGVPFVNIGFNEHVAWTHTVTPANHFTVYALQLVDGDPTSYLYEGQPRKLTSEDVTIDVLESDGSKTQVARTYYRSHYGPMVRGPGLVWTTKSAFSYRDANETDLRLGEQWMRMDMAKSLDELVAVHAEVRGIPWVYTIATSAEGEAMVLDGSRVPKLSAEALAAYDDRLASDSLTQTLAGAGVILLDGSTARDEWVDGGIAGQEGLVPIAEAPQLRRTDFAMNANDPAWLTNPKQPLVDYPMQYGSTRTPASPRTRMNLTMLTTTDEASAPGPDGKITLDELSSAILRDRAMIAELLRGPVADRCAQVATVDVDGTPVDITGACAALAAWNGRMDLDEAGPVVFREMLGEFSGADLYDAGALFDVPFDPDDPVATPNTLSPAPVSGPDPILVALGRAVQKLGAAGLGPSATLGEAQFTLKGDLRIPIHGGQDWEGVTNVVTYGSENNTLLPRLPRSAVVDGATDLTLDGYLVNYGSSFVMALEYRDDGPHAVALLSYAESSDPSSPHFSDQTERFSGKAFRPVVFTEADIAADPELSVTTLTAPRP